MKLKYKMLIIILVLSLLLVGIATIGIINAKGSGVEHKLEDAKTYHISSDMCYYTKECKHCGTTSFSTNMNVHEILSSVNEADKIVLDEDLVVEDNFILNGYNTESKKYIEQLTINLDLNGYTITSKIEDNSIKSLFDLQAVICSINLNVWNGNLNSEGLLYVFDFTSATNKQINLSLNNVDCTTYGENSTPLFAHNTANNMNITANNCDFIAQKDESLLECKNVGAFINSNSQFNFNNCTFLGGDGLYVKQGNINLAGCTLINSGLGNQIGNSGIANVEDTFSAIGRCLTAVSQTYQENNELKCNKYNIVIDRCEFIAQTSFMAIQINDVGVTDKPSIDIISAKFNSYDVTDSLDNEIVTLSNSVQTIGENLFLIGIDF